MEKAVVQGSARIILKLLISNGRNYAKVLKGYHSTNLPLISKINFVINNVQRKACPPVVLHYEISYDTPKS